MSCRYSTGSVSDLRLGSGPNPGAAGRSRSPYRTNIACFDLATKVMSSTSSDTMPIRAGEELDWAALAAYLREHLPAVLPGEAFDSLAPIEVEQFPGGHSNLTYLVR